MFYGLLPEINHDEADDEYLISLLIFFSLYSVFIVNSQFYQHGRLYWSKKFFCIGC